MKRLLKVLILLSLTTQVSVAKTYQPVPSTVKLPAKYTQEYIDSISDEYKNVFKSPENDHPFFGKYFWLKESYFKYPKADK